MPQKPPLIAVFNDDQVVLGLMEELLAEESYATHSDLVGPYQDATLFLALCERQNQSGIF